MTKPTPRLLLVSLVMLVALVAAYLVGSARGSSAGSPGRLAVAPVGAVSALDAGSSAQKGSGLSAQNASVPLGADPTGASSGSAGITVTGTGIVSGTPDALALDMSVTSSGASVTAALADANATASAVQKSLLGHGVATKDLQTSGLSIQATYDKDGRVVTGYQVSESVHAVIHGLGTAGEAVSAAVAAGGNAARVDNIGLDLGDTGPLVSQARDSAFAQAKAKAEQYARAAGANLGRVVSITDATVSATPERTAAFASAGAKAADLSPVPIQAGSQDVSVTATVVFALA